jgi:hypothetical protein
MVSAAWTVQAMPIAAMLAESVKALIKLRRFIVRSPWSLCFSGWQMQTLKALLQGVCPVGERL